MRQNHPGLADPRATDPRAADPRLSAHDPSPPIDQDTARPADVEAGPLFSEDEVARFRERWQAIQTGFVDDPREAVRAADKLVEEVLQALAATFTEHRRGLEAQSQTEDLRLALRRYRSLFQRLLAA